LPCSFYGDDENVFINNISIIVSKKNNLPIYLIKFFDVLRSFLKYMILNLLRKEAYVGVLLKEYVLENVKSHIKNSKSIEYNPRSSSHVSNLIIYYSL